MMNPYLLSLECIMPLPFIRNDDVSSESEDDSAGARSNDKGDRTFIMDRFLPAAKAMASLPYLMKPDANVHDIQDEISFNGCGFCSLRLKNAFNQSPRMDKKYSLSVLSARKILESDHSHGPGNPSDGDASSSGTDEEEEVDVAASGRKMSWEAALKRHKPEQDIMMKNASRSNCYPGRGSGYFRGFSDPKASPKIGDALLNRISYNSLDPYESSAGSRTPLRKEFSGGISPYRNEAPMSPFREGKGFLGFPRHSRVYSTVPSMKDGIHGGQEDSRCWNPGPIPRGMSASVSPTINEGNCRPVDVSGFKDENRDMGHVNAKSGEVKYNTISPVSVMPPPLPKSPSESWLSRAMPLVVSQNSHMSPARGYKKCTQVQQRSFEDSFDDAKWETI